MDVGAGVGRGGRVAGGTVVAGGATVVAGGEGASVEGGGGGVPGDGVESGLFVGCGVGAGFVVGCGVGAGLVVGCGVGAGLVVGCGVGAGFVDGAGVSVGAGFVEAAGVSVGAGFVDGVSWAKTAVESSRRTAGKMGGKKGKRRGKSRSPTAIALPSAAVVPPFQQTHAHAHEREGERVRAPPPTPPTAGPPSGADGKLMAEHDPGAPAAAPPPPGQSHRWKRSALWGRSGKEAQAERGEREKTGRGRVETKKMHGRQIHSSPKNVARGAPHGTPPHPRTPLPPPGARKRRSPLSWGLRKTHAPFNAGPAAARPGGGEAG